VADIKDIVLAPECRHRTLRTVALYAQRIGKVFASPTFPDAYLRAGCFAGTDKTTIVDST
jgi:hypothetical protein